MKRRHVLYRYFDGDGKLLYVGISVRWDRRLREHALYSEWYARVTSVTLEDFDTRDAVLLAEKKAITTESPECNIANKRGSDYDPIEAEDPRQATRRYLTRRIMDFIESLECVDSGGRNERG